MKKRAFRLGAACVLASVAISAAHAVSNTKTIRLATFDEPFNDPDNSGAVAKIGLLDWQDRLQ